MQIDQTPLRSRVAIDGQARGNFLEQRLVARRYHSHPHVPGQFHDKIRDERTCGLATISPTWKRRGDKQQRVWCAHGFRTATTS